MRKVASVLGALVLVMGSFALVARSASAQGSAPDWTVKDFWQYSGSMEILSETYTTILHLEVKEKIAVTLGANTYDTNHCTMTMTASFGSSSITIAGDVWMRTSDLAIVKTESTFMSTTTTTTYEPPLEIFKFPLSSGQTWTSTTTQTTKTGSITNSDNQTTTYIVTGPTSINVPAGAFNAFTVTAQEQGGSSNSTIDYSDSVGSMIRFEGDFMGMESDSPFVLKSFNYQKPGFIMTLTVGILLLVVIVAVIAALLLMRGRRKKLMQMQMPLQSQPMYGRPPQQPPYQPPPPP